MFVVDFVVSFILVWFRCGCGCYGLFCFYCDCWVDEVRWGEVVL